MRYLGAPSVPRGPFRRREPGGAPPPPPGPAAQADLARRRAAAKAERLGAGEIFLNSIDRDGTGQGYDIDLIRSVATAVRIPVIACGGVGRYEDYARGILEGKASAVSAGVTHPPTGPCWLSKARDKSLI